MRRDDHRSVLCAEVPPRLDDAQATAAVAGQASVTSDPGDDLIVARRIVVRNYRLAAEAGEVRANDPIRRARERLPRTRGPRAEVWRRDRDQLPGDARDARKRALAGRRRFEALPLEATGGIIEVTTRGVAVAPKTDAKRAGDT